MAHKPIKAQLKAARASQKRQHQGLVVLKARNKLCERLFEKAMGVIRAQANLIQRITFKE